MALMTDWEYTKYIVGSSLLFQIPALYAYHHEMYTMSASCFITCVLSMNYWRHASYSWRRDMDMYWAKSAGVYYFIHGIQYTSLGIPGVLIMLYFYYQSNEQFRRNPYGNWYMYHMAFHGMAALNQLGTLYYIKNSRIN